MIKPRIHLFILLIVCLFTSCNQIDRDNSLDTSVQKNDNFIKLTKNLKMTTGFVHFDTLPNSLLTHKLDSGSNRIFVYERSGVTMIDASDWEAKYTETLIFQVDSLIDSFEYCDSSLMQIDCKYYWICIAKDFKKEIISIDNGCIKMDFSNDSIMIDINVNPNFGFGGLLDKDKDRTIKHKTTMR